MGLTYTLLDRQHASEPSSLSYPHETPDLSRWSSDQKLGGISLKTVSPSNIIDKIALRYVEALLASEFGQRERAAILQQAGLVPQDLSPENGYVGTEVYSRLLKSILRRSADESFAFLANGLRPGTFALLCQAMLAAPDLGAALRTAQRFFRLVSPDFVIQIFKTPHELRFELQLLKPLQGPEHFFTEAVFAVFLRLSSWLIDRTIVPSAMNFTYSPEHSGRAFESKYACPIHFHQTVSSLTIAQEYVEEPIKRSPDQLRRILRISLQSLLLDFKKNESFQSRVSAYFMQKPQHLAHGLEEIAAFLALNPSTLRRRLREEGHNVNELREKVRRQRSLYFLACTHKSVDAIALELGYSEASTFHRAFKKWTGATPQRYRQKDREPSCQPN